MPRSCYRLALPCLLGLSLACGGRTGTPAAQAQPVREPEADAADSCPSEQLPETRAPDVLPAHEQARYWLAKYDAEDNQPELMDADARAALHALVSTLPGGWRDPLGEVGADEALVTRELGERLAWLRGRVEDGKYVELEAGAFAAAAARVEGATAIEQPALRFVAVETPLWCIPTDAGLFTEPVDHDFDRNRCASLHPGELVRTLRSAEQGAWLYVEAGHSVGWVDQRGAATLEPPLSIDDARTRRDAGTRAFLRDDYQTLRAGSSFPIVGGRDQDPLRVLVPGVDGPRELDLPPEAPASRGPLTFTRAQLFTQAFALLEQPYGWGGRAGQRDCSRYLYDLFAQFELKLARNSGVQAKLGARSVDVSELDEAAKREAIRAAANTGVVLLYMPGHIMLYLGHEGELDYGISALSEYLTPCEGGEDTIHRLDKVAVTTLELGRKTERRAFIERITRIAVFAPDT